jgi:hypothetical protein
MEKILGHKDIHQICIDFLTDGIVSAIERWLLDKDCMPPEQFVSNLKTIVQGAAMEVYHDMNEK